MILKINIILRSPLNVLHSVLVIRIIIISIIIIMNKSQELTVFHGRQKLISAKN